MEEVIHLLLQSRDYTHFKHWNDRLYARHMALEQYYTGILDIVDRMAEAYMGSSGVIAIPDSIKMPDDENPSAYLTKVSAALDALSRNLAREDLKNITAEALELVNITLYRLSLERGYLKTENYVAENQKDS